MLSFLTRKPEKKLPEILSLFPLSATLFPGGRVGLKVFEQRYGVTTAFFLHEMAAEDLAGGDLEYVEWAGEYKLRMRLQEHLRQLQEVEYAVA